MTCPKSQHLQQGHLGEPLRDPEHHLLGTEREREREEGERETKMDLWTKTKKTEGSLTSGNGKSESNSRISLGLYKVLGAPPLLPCLTQAELTPGRMGLGVGMRCYTFLQPPPVLTSLSHPSRPSEV